MKDPITVIYRASEKAKVHKMLVFRNHTIDEVLSNTKRKPLIPYKNCIDVVGVGQSFIERYKKSYNIKKYEELE